MTTPPPDIAAIAGKLTPVTQADRDAEANAYMIRCIDEDDVAEVAAMIRAGHLDMWTSLQERAAVRAHLLSKEGE